MNNERGRSYASNEVKPVMLVTCTRGRLCGMVGLEMERQVMVPEIEFIIPGNTTGLFHCQTQYAAHKTQKHKTQNK